VVTGAILWEFESPPAHMSFFNSANHFLERHERTISLFTLVGGFIFDFFTLQRVDFLLDNIFIMLYLAISGTGIILINLYEVGRLRGGFIEKIHELLTFLIQFCFGGLFSAFVIFYSRSAAFLTSGVFIAILLILFIGNEFIKTKYSKLTFQIGIYFAATFFFTIYFLPILVHRMNPAVFVFSGLISVGLISLFIFLIARLARVRFKESAKALYFTIGIIYLSINFLYFTNIIPPIPLSMKSGDVYHYLEKHSGIYYALGEKNTWKEKLGLGQVFHYKEGETVYLFSSIFAPTDLNIKITHDWEYYNENKNKWESISKVSFPIFGGRSEGYRGFTKKENIYPGKWRVDIKTPSGQVIGRVRFDIEKGNGVVEESQL
jgi:hypothetical protein